MFNIVLFNPQIPQNTGNIARTCAVTGSKLHLIKPLGFTIDDKSLKRAGLDYWQDVNVTLHENFAEFMSTVGEHNVYLLSSKAKKSYVDCEYKDGDYLLFGSETSGVPEYVHECLRSTEMRVPMVASEHARCLNLSNTVALALYEALRQNSFLGMK